MKIIFTLFIGLLIVAENHSYTQDNLTFCKQHVVQAELPQTPTRVERLKNFEIQQAAVQEMMKNQPPTRQTYTIPIVFHVIHYGGPENISDAQIADAIDVLNRDFSLQNTDANNVVFQFNASNPNAVATPADIGIHFVLAKKAPDGTCFNGITRTVSPTTFSTSNGFVQLDALINGNDIYRNLWPSNNYLNIIVVENLGSAAGYTFLPGSFNGSNMYGSIWVNPTYVGRIGSGSEIRSRTLTHEVGHWLNLNHVWGPTNDPGLASNCNTDDGVTDTPNTIGSTTCKLSENTCGPLANVENYMDYSYCSKMFTQGQKARMLAALQVAPRDIIWTPTNLSQTGVDGNLGLCSANFNVLKESFCVNEPVSFTDQSIEGQTSWLWQFEGGNPATSTIQNPLVTYALPGKYNVSLTVSDGTNTLTTTKNDFVNISPTDSLPYFEGFEGYSHITDITEATLHNVTPNAATFDIAHNSAATGNQSLVYMGYYSGDISTNEFISPNFDLSKFHNPDKITLTFKYAYQKKDSLPTYKEHLGIYATNDCGGTWLNRKMILANQLSNIINSNNFIATSSDFKTVHVTGITSTFFTGLFKFKLAFESSGNNNNLYLDDINLYEGSPSDTNVLSVNDVTSNLSKLTIQPNPSYGVTTLIFHLSQDANVPLRIIDTHGKIMYENTLMGANGENEVLFDTSNYGKGIYFVRLGNTTEKMIVK